MADFRSSNELAAARHSQGTSVQPHPARVRADEADDLAVSIFIDEGRNIVLGPGVVEHGPFEVRDERRRIINGPRPNNPLIQGGHCGKVVPPERADAHDALPSECASGRPG
jgi:hypothetical protein